VKRATQQFRDQFGTLTMPFEIWIDRDDLLRRMVFRMESGGGSAGSLSMAMTMDVTEYGNDFDLPIPRPRDVTDVSELAGAAGAA
jgi:hypothetical protein